MCHTFVVIVTQTERCSMKTTNGKIAEQSKQKIANALHAHKKMQQQLSLCVQCTVHREVYTDEVREGEMV